MYDNVLVPMALDHGISPQMLEVAQALLSPSGKITALHVYEAPEGSVGAFLDDSVVNAAYEKAKSRLAEKTADLEGLETVIIKGHSARSIIDYADANAVDCIVIGSHKPDLRDYFLGSTAARVVRHAPCAVHVMRTQN
ncbi:MAG: universal stress protein [Arenibacterium sp.]